MSQLKTFLVSVSPGDKVARIRAQLLHILYELGKDDHQFRLRYNGQIMRDAFLLSDYDITDNAVVTMIPMGKSKDVCLFFLFFFSFFGCLFTFPLRIHITLTIFTLFLHQGYNTNNSNCTMLLWSGKVI